MIHHLPLAQVYGMVLRHGAAHHAGLAVFGGPAAIEQVAEQKIGRDLIPAQNRARFFSAMTTTVDKKGSVPLPAEVLCDSGVHPGDELDVTAEGESIILRKVTRAPEEGLLDILRGLKGLPVPERSRSSVRHVQL
jgi:AbrB family looped-hinge helix DNA binding protein